MTKSKLIASSLIATLLLGGCTATNTNYNSSNYNTIKQVQYGKIISVKEVEINDAYLGKLVGAVAGGLLGSQFGKGSGKTVATVAGAATGAYAGHKINSTTGQEITIQKTNGEKIITAIKGNEAIEGLEVEIIIADNKLIELKPYKLNSKEFKEISNPDGSKKLVSSDNKSFPARFQIVN